MILGYLVEQALEGRDGLSVAGLGQGDQNGDQRIQTGLWIRRRGAQSFDRLEQGGHRAAGLEEAEGLGSHGHLEWVLGGQGGLDGRQRLGPQAGQLDRQAGDDGGGRVHALQDLLGKLGLGHRQALGPGALVQAVGVDVAVVTVHEEHLGRGQHGHGALGASVGRGEHLLVHHVDEPDITVSVHMAGEDEDAIA